MLADALKHMDVPVSKKEVQAENEIERVTLSSLAGHEELHPMSGGLSRIRPSEFRMSDLSDLSQLEKLYNLLRKGDNPPQE